MISSISKYGSDGFVPLGTLEMSLNGIQRVLYHSINEYPHQMAFKRGFLEVLREEHFALVSQNNYEKVLAMENAQYFTAEALKEVYPVLEYLASRDKQLVTGKRYVTIGTVEKPIYVVKVGEAVSKTGDNWKTGIFRVASVLLSEAEEG